LGPGFTQKKVGGFRRSPVAAMRKPRSGCRRKACAVAAKAATGLGWPAKKLAGKKPPPPAGPADGGESKRKRRWGHRRLN